MTAEFVLHGSPHSQFTYKIALMLRLAGKPFSFRYVSFQKGEHLTSEFLALSRWGQVPVLEHRERVLCQSGAILEYLAETIGAFNGPTATAAQQVREWLFWAADRLSPPVYGRYGVRLAERNLLPIHIDPVIAASDLERLNTALAVLDAQLDGRAFLVAEMPTIADLCCYGDVAFAELSGADLRRLLNLGRWGARIANLPGFKEPFRLLKMEHAEILPGD